MVGAEEPSTQNSGTLESRLEALRMANGPLEPKPLKKPTNLETKIRNEI